MLFNQSSREKEKKIIIRILTFEKHQCRHKTGLTALGIGLGWVPDFVDETGAASSSDDESLLNPTAEGPLLATLMYVRNGEVPLPAKDLADLKLTK